MDSELCEGQRVRFVTSPGDSLFNQKGHIISLNKSWQTGDLVAEVLATINGQRCFINIAAANLMPY